MAGDNDESGFQRTVEGFPWLNVPFDEIEKRKGPIGEKVPCTGYPTPGIVDAKSGNVISADAFDEMGGGMNDADKLLAGWVSQL